jgi:predicted phage gp36 major capsid-like protein
VGGREPSHAARFVRPEGRPRNATSLASDLRRAFEAIELELRNDPELRDMFYKRDRKNRELHLDKSDAERWCDALKNASTSSERWPPPEPSQGRNRPAGPTLRASASCVA